MADKRLVVIGETTYSLVELPGGDTQLVLDERAKLLGQIDLKTLVEDLGRVGRCIRVAYNGVTAAGPKFTELQIEVQGLGYDVTKLCDKSAITVSKFKRACSTILTDLQATYEYLLDNFEDLALETLAAVTNIAGQMAVAAEELHQNFDDEATKVREVLNKTQRSEGDQAILAEEMKAKQREFEIKQGKQEELLQQARKAEQDAEQKLHEYEMKEDKAIQDLGDEGGLLTKLANGLTSKVLGTRVFGKSQETKERQLDAISQKKKEALEKTKEREKMRLEAFQKLTDFAVSIENCKDEKDFAKAAADALHKAMEGLKMLAALMMQAALFWKQMQVHCMALSESKMKDTVEKAMDKYDDAKRLKLWTSTGFKKQAVQFYAGWVALDGVCGEYMSAIQETQKELYKYITENPNYEEAEVNVKQLAIAFKDEMEEAQRAITERDSEMAEEIKNFGGK